jgi:hypothetical protein
MEQDGLSYSQIAQALNLKGKNYIFRVRSGSSLAEHQKLGVSENLLRVLNYCEMRAPDFAPDDRTPRPHDLERVILRFPGLSDTQHRELLAVVRAFVKVARDER